MFHLDSGENNQTCTSRKEPGTVCFADLLVILLSSLLKSHTQSVATGGSQLAIVLGPCVVMTQSRNAVYCEAEVFTVFPRRIGSLMSGDRGGEGAETALSFSCLYTNGACP